MLHRRNIYAYELLLRPPYSFETFLYHYQVSAEYGRKIPGS